MAASLTGKIPAKPEVGEDLLTAFLADGKARRRGEISDETYIRRYIECRIALEISVPDNSHREDIAVQLQEALHLSGGADMDKMTELLAAMAENNRDTPVIITAIQNILAENGLSSHPLQDKLLEYSYRMNPSGENSYRMALKAQRGNDIEARENYLKEAIRTSSDNALKAKCQIELARLHLSRQQFPEAKGEALQAMESAPDSGMPYMLIGLAYMESASQGNFRGGDFMKSTIFWAAADKFRQAIKKDPSLTDEADKQIGMCRAQFPSMTDGFLRDIAEGAPYHIGGWINETTTARFQK